MNRLKLFIPLIIFLVMAGFLLMGLKNDPSHLPSALLGKPLPDFSLPTLADQEKVVTPKDLTGEPFLLNVWASWCPTCRFEHPYLQKLSEQGVIIYGLNYKDEHEAATTWLKDLGNPYKLNIFDENGRLGLDLGVYGAPETYVVSASGEILYRHVGEVNDKVWKTKLAPLMQ